MPPRTHVYIDGFNLYYGAVKATPFKWLNVQRLCELLLPDSRIDKIRYFTARLSARQDDPDKPTRQQIYLRALRTIPSLEITYGSFLSDNVVMPLVDPPPGGPKFARVVTLRMGQSPAASWGTHAATGHVTPHALRPSASTFRAAFSSRSIERPQSQRTQRSANVRASKTAPQPEQVLEV